MKHGIYYAYWEKEWAADYTYYVDKVARLGFDILEVGAAPLPDYTPEQIRALRDCVKANGIELTAGYGPTYDHNLGSSDPAIRKNAKEWFTRLFDVMAQLDIHLIGGALYSYWPLDFSKGVDKEGDWKRSVEAMQDIAPVAAQYGINMGMEVLNRFENHILNTAEEGVAFVKEVGMDNIKVMLDTFHMNIEESSIGDAIRTAGSLLGTFPYRRMQPHGSRKRTHPLARDRQRAPGISGMTALWSWSPSSPWADRLARTSMCGATSAAALPKNS